MPEPFTQPQGLFDVAGKVVLVTGGGSGLGLMLARCFAGCKARVYICGRKADRLQHAAESFGGAAIVADIATAEGVETVRKALIDREERLDVLINNAGASWVSSIDDFPETGWEKVFDINTKAPFFLTKALLPLLEASSNANESWSRIVMISSARGSMAEGSSVAYNVSKAALNQMTRVLAKALADRHITVNTIAPGWFETDLNRAVIAGKVAEIVASQPIKRLGTEDDIAGAALFLCSRAGAFVTGHILPLDGGLVPTA